MNSAAPSMSNTVALVLPRSGKHRSGSSLEACLKSLKVSNPLLWLLVRVAGR